MLVFKNNDSRLKNELEELKNRNKALYDLVQDLVSYIDSQFKKDLVLTMVFRTQEEQDSLYANDDKYKARKFKSPHQFYHSVDIRSLSFNSDEIKKIEDYLNGKYNSKNFYKWTARNHKIQGNVEHFHIQFVGK